MKLKLTTIVLCAIFLSLTSCISHQDTTQASISLGKDNTPISTADKTTPGQINRLSASDIETALIKWHGQNQIILTKDEIITLVKLLKKVQKSDITRYYGPAPKGGPANINLLLTSNENLTLVLNGDYFLFGGKQVYQIYLPELNEFTFSRIKKYFK
jgi:hypothetical protein